MVVSVSFHFSWLSVFGLVERGEDKDSGGGGGNDGGGCCRRFQMLTNGGVL